MSSALRMEYRPADLLPAQQPQITGFAQTVRQNNWSELGSSTTAIVYSYRSQWWHSTINDQRLHVTVRYDRRVPATRRVHIYQDGTANLFPHQGTTALSQSVSADVEEGSDGSVEFSDEEGQENPASAAN